MQRHLPEVFALCREAAVRTIGLRNFDVQMIAGIALHEGRIAEQKTGEGKTLVRRSGAGAQRADRPRRAPDHRERLPGAARRGVDGADLPPAGHQRRRILQHDTRGAKRAQVYGQEVVYGTNNEFGFDYLRDNMVIHAREIVQGELNYGIVDECDSILIDEARTPLIISGSSTEDTSLYTRVDGVVRRLSRRTSRARTSRRTCLSRPSPQDGRGQRQDLGLRVRPQEPQLDPDRARHRQGRARAGRCAAGRSERRRAAGRTCSPMSTRRSRTSCSRPSARTGSTSVDVEYVVKDGEVIIVDEFTGRLMFGGATRTACTRPSRRRKA